MDRHWPTTLIGSAGSFDTLAELISAESSTPRDAGRAVRRVRLRFVRHHQGTVDRFHPRGTDQPEGDTRLPVDTLPMALIAIERVLVHGVRGPVQPLRAEGGCGVARLRGWVSRSRRYLPTMRRFVRDDAVMRFVLRPTPDSGAEPSRYALAKGFRALNSTRGTRPRTSCSSASVSSPAAFGLRASSCRTASSMAVPRE